MQVKLTEKVANDSVSPIAVLPSKFCVVTYANPFASAWQVGDVVFVTAESTIYNLTRNLKYPTSNPYVKVRVLTAGDKFEVTI